MRIHCMRHGQSEYNLLGLCNDDPGRNVRLTALGRLQAEAAARQLNAVRFDAIFCSELPRARETAEIVASGRGLSPSPNPLLNDIRSGCDGRPVAEYFALIAADRLHSRVGAGETLLEHKARVLQFLDWLLAQSLRQVLLVAHEETLRVFFAVAHGMSDAAMLDLSFANCEVFEIEFGEA